MSVRLGVVGGVVAVGFAAAVGCLQEPSPGGPDATTSVIDASSPSGDGAPHYDGPSPDGALVDATPVPVELSVQDAVVYESNGRPVFLEFEVRLNIASMDQVAVQYATRDVTATAGVDYEAAWGNLVFGAGQTSRVVQVTLLADRLPEPDEQLDLTLLEPSGAAIQRRTGVGTIADDDRGFDFDADGYADLIVGAPGAQEEGRGAGSGAAYLFFGPITGTGSGAVADLVVVGSLAGHALGRRVAGGDLNGDGVADLIVGVREHDGVGGGAGAVLVFYGVRGQRPEPAAGDSRVVWDEDDADIVIVGAAAGDRFGVSVAAADVNGDGLSDLVVGARDAKPAGTATGAVYVFLGGATLPARLTADDADQRIAGTVANSAFGNPAAAAGDVNGDGYDDLIVGAASDDRAYLFYGGSAPAAERSAVDADVAIRSTQTGAVFGLGARSAGDVNGDGLDDVILGGPAYTNAQFGDGAAFVFFGSTTLPATMTTDDASWTLLGETGSRAGFDVAGAGDVDGDGYADLLVGERLGLDRSEGAAYLVFGGDLTGSSGVSVAGVSVVGDEPDLYLGTYVTGGTDFNGDGRHDLLIGGPYDGGSLPGIGKVLLFLGRTSWPAGPLSPEDADAVRTGRVIKDGFGSCDHR